MPLVMKTTYMCALSSEIMPLVIRSKVHVKFHFAYSAQGWVSMSHNLTRKQLRIAHQRLMMLLFFGDFRSTNHGPSIVTSPFRTSKLCTD